MTNKKLPQPHVSQSNLTSEDSAAIERFSLLVIQRTAVLAGESGHPQLVNLVRQALSDALITMGEGTVTVDPTLRLPVEKLSAVDVVASGLVDLSKASLYRAAESGRFYCTTPSGRSIGRVFPAWQFVMPVPELLPAILAQFKGQPSSDIHAFFVSETDFLNDLSPAEVLAGRPFLTRDTIHSSQNHLMGKTAKLRSEAVLESARRHLNTQAHVTS